MVASLIAALAAALAAVFSALALAFLVLALAFDALALEFLISDLDETFASSTSDSTGSVTVIVSTIGPPLLSTSAMRSELVAGASVGSFGWNTVDQVECCKCICQPSTHQELLVDI